MPAHKGPQALMWAAVSAPLEVEQHPIVPRLYQQGMCRRFLQCSGKPDNHPAAIAPLNVDFYTFNTIIVSESFTTHTTISKQSKGFNLWCRTFWIYNKRGSWHALWHQAEFTTRHVALDKSSGGFDTKQIQKILIHWIAIFSGSKIVYQDQRAGVFTRCVRTLSRCDTVVSFKLAEHG